MSETESRLNITIVSVIRASGILQKITGKQVRITDQDIRVFIEFISAGQVHLITDMTPGAGCRRPFNRTTRRVKVVLGSIQIDKVQVLLEFKFVCRLGR